MEVLALLGTVSTARQVDWDGRQGLAALVQV
jgi:hypothetical protein